MKFIKLFTRRSVRDVMQDMLYEAERLALEYEAAAEHYAAMATVYKARVERLQESLYQDGGAV